MLELLIEHKIPQRGFVRQEDCRFEDFISNRFGEYYNRDQQVQDVDYRHLSAVS